MAIMKIHRLFWTVAFYLVLRDEFSHASAPFRTNHVTTEGNHVTGLVQLDSSHVATGSTSDKIASSTESYHVTRSSHVSDKTSGIGNLTDETTSYVSHSENFNSKRTSPMAETTNNLENQTPSVKDHVTDTLLSLADSTNSSTYTVSPCLGFYNYRCRSGKCISIYKFCNGVKNCGPGGEDEFDDICKRNRSESVSTGFPLNSEQTTYIPFEKSGATQVTEQVSSMGPKTAEVPTIDPITSEGPTVDAFSKEGSNISHVTGKSSTTGHVAEEFSSIGQVTDGESPTGHVTEASTSPKPTSEPTPDYNSNQSDFTVGYTSEEVNTTNDINTGVAAGRQMVLPAIIIPCVIIFLLVVGLGAYARLTHGRRNKQRSLTTPNELNTESPELGPETFNGCVLQMNDAAIDSTIDPDDAPMLHHFAAG